jgi:Gram-negative porin
MEKSMNRKILALTMAAALVVPMMAQADVKLSGVIQAETGSAKLGMAKDRLRVTGDGDGALLNGGPNRLRFDIDEKLSNGWSAMARYQVAFNTSSNAGLVDGQESWVGLKMNSEAFYFRFGKLEGNYKALKAMVDPFAGTSLQARGTAGGMSGSSHLTSCTTATAGKGLCKNYPDVDDAGDIPSTIAGLGTRSALAGFTHSSYVNNALELGTKMGGFSASLQGVWDQTDVLNGGGLIALQYTHDNFDVFASAAYTDLDSSVGSGSVSKLDSGGNWKVGGAAKFAGMTLGLQYEHAEIGTLTDSFDNLSTVGTSKPIAGKYLLGSIDFRADNLAIGGWVAKYSESKDDLQKAGFVTNGVVDDHNALSFAVGLKYFLSKRTLAFGGYQQTNSKVNTYDQKVVGVGVRHSF